MSLGLKGAVGNSNAGGISAPNRAVDQQIVAELLDAAEWHPPLIPLVEQLSAIEDGIASPLLTSAITDFQSRHQLTADGRVDVGGQTWLELKAQAAAALADPLPAPIVLSLDTLTVNPLPRIASGLPSITYIFEGTPNTYAAPGLTIELTISGSIKVDWGNAMPLAMAASSSTAMLQTWVETGTARNVAGLTLRDESSNLQFESRTAIGSLFASVTLSMTAAGPVLGDSLGDPQGFAYVSWDPLAGAAVFRGERQILRHVNTSFGAPLTLSGRLRLELKVTKADADHQASVIAALAVLIPVGYIVLAPAVALTGESAMLGVMRAGASNLLKLVPMALQWSTP